MQAIKRFRGYLLPLFALLTAWAAAHAEQADRFKPINLLAGSFEHNDAKGESMATGGVVFTKGSILVRADKAVVREDAQGYQHAHMTAQPGQRVFFRQKRDGADDEFIQAEARAIDYDGRTDVVTLVGHGQLLQFRAGVLAGELLGERITHDGAQGRFAADGAVAGAESAAKAGKPGQVRLMLMPRVVPVRADPF